MKKFLRRAGMTGAGAATIAGGGALIERGGCALLLIVGIMTVFAFTAYKSFRYAYRDRNRKDS